MFSHGALCMAVLAMANAAPAVQDAAPPAATSLLSDEMKRFTAYDCSTPTHIQMVEVPEEDRDCDGPLQIHQVVNSSYSMLQLAETTDVRIIRCQATLTTKTSFCGWFDYSTHMDSIDVDDRPVPISPSDCRKMFDTRLYAHYDGTRWPVHVNETTVLRIQEAGANTFSADHVDCEGGTWRPPNFLRAEIMRHGPGLESRFHGDSISGVMRTATVKVTLEVVNGIKDEEDQSVTVEKDSLRLPEAYPQGSYVTADTTYVWTIGADRCRLHVVRDFVAGTDTVTEKGTVFTSNRDTLVRLLKRKEVEMCGTKVWATNFPKAFLGDPRDKRHFSTDLHVREHSQMLYTNIQDAYILNYLRSYMGSSITKAIRDECIRRKQGREWELADKIADRKSTL